MFHSKFNSVPFLQKSKNKKNLHLHVWRISSCSFSQLKGDFFSHAYLYMLFHMIIVISSDLLVLFMRSMSTTREQILTASGLLLCSREC